MYRLLADTLSDRTLVQVNAVLRKAMKDAVKEGSIIYNPIDRVLKQPTAVRKEMDTLSSTEVKALLDIDNKWTPLFTLLTGTGLRIGEALGLEWASVDMEHGVLSVTRSLQNVPKLGFIFNEPKTEASRRIVPLNIAVVSAMKTHQARQASQRLSLGPNWKDQGLVFPNSWGSPMWVSTAQRALDRSLKEVGVDRHIRIHDLRHTCGSLMHQSRVAAKEIQNILGHENIQTTLNLYVHTNPETLRDAVDTLGAAIAR
jgi:integrase